MRRRGGKVEWSLFGLIASALLPSLAPAATCVSTGSFAWNGAGSGSWSCGAGGPADAYEIANGHTVTLAHDLVLTGSGSVVVRNGGSFVARGALRLVLGAAGLRCDPGSRCELEGPGMRALSTGASALLPALGPEALGRVQTLRHCPTSGGGADCVQAVAGGRVRLAFPAGAPAGLASLAAGDVLCFGDGGISGAGHPDDAACYEVRNDPSSADPEIELDVTQSPSGRDAAGYPLAWRRILASAVRDTAGVARGQRTVRVDGAVASEGQPMSGRWVRFADAAGAPEPRAYKLVGVVDGGGGSDDTLTIGSATGFERPYPAGRALWVDAGWSYGDPFFAWQPLRVSSATAAEADTPVVLAGATTVRRVIFEGIGSPTNGQPSTGAIRLSAGATVTAFEDVWLADPSAPPAAISFVIDSVPVVVVRRFQQTGGTSSTSGCAPYTSQCADYLHVFGFSGPLPAVWLEDVVVRHHGDDVLLSLGAFPFNLVVRRLQAAFTSRYAASGSLLDAAGFPVNVDFEDVVCDDCTSPPNGGDLAGSLFSLTQVTSGRVDGILVWGTRGGAACDGAFASSDVVAIGSVGGRGFLVGGSSERVLVRDMAFDGAPSGLAYPNEALTLRQALIRDSSFANDRGMFFPTSPSAPIDVEDTVLLDVNGRDVSYLWAGGPPAAPVRFRHVSAVWTRPHTTDRFVTAGGTLPPSMVTLDSVLVQGLDGPGEIAVDLPLAQISAPGTSCFFDDTAAWPSSQDPFAPAGWLFSNGLGPSDPPRAPSYPWISGLGCGAGGTVGVSAERWLHGKSRIAPEFFGDADGDGIAAPVDDCPLDFDPAQVDTDHDGVGDPCDDECTAAGPTLVSEVVPASSVPGNWIEVRARGVGPSTIVRLGGVPMLSTVQAGKLLAQTPFLPAGQAYPLVVENPEGCRSQERVTLTVAAAGCGLLGIEAAGLLVLAATGLGVQRRLSRVSRKERSRIPEATTRPRSAND
jgi:hypothetical protein